MPGAARNASNQAAAICRIRLAAVLAKTVAGNWSGCAWLYVLPWRSAAVFEHLLAIRPHGIRPAALEPAWPVAMG